MLFIGDMLVWRWPGQRSANRHPNVGAPGLAPTSPLCSSGTETADARRREIRILSVRCGDDRHAPGRT
jgi:hypothetical protein